MHAANAARMDRKLPAARTALEIDTMGVMETRPSGETQQPVRRLLRPFVRFAGLESASSIVLLGSTLAALFLANSGFAGTYESVLQRPLRVDLGPYVPQWTVERWINDALMAVFFLVVGLEVKRELLVGELASFRRAILPVLAALGGVLAPALIYLSLNHTAATRRGWGIPIATDIAFSLAVLVSFGKRIPFALRIFLASLAIADDIGGVLVIAFAYSSGVHPAWLAAAGVVFLLCLGMNRAGVTWLSPYLLLGTLLWVSFERAGVHPTLAGIALAMAVPARRKSSEKLPEPGSPREAGEASQTAAPLDRMEEALHPWVSFGVMPLFALANAGVTFRGFHAAAAADPVFLGVALGLLLGKPIGITVFSWIAVRLSLAKLPRGVSWAQMHAVSWVAGIGFTVAIFMAGLAFEDAQRYTQIRIAILAASACAATGGALLLALTSRGGPKGTGMGRGASVAEHEASVPNEV